jgi:hypothetical protein
MPGDKATATMTEGQNKTEHWDDPHGNSFGLNPSIQECATSRLNHSGYLSRTGYSLLGTQDSDDGEGLLPYSSQ